MDVFFYVVAMGLLVACAGTAGSFFTTRLPLDFFAALALAFFGGVALAIGCMLTLRHGDRIGKRGGR